MKTILKEKGTSFKRAWESVSQVVKLFTDGECEHQRNQAAESSEVGWNRENIVPISTQIVGIGTFFILLSVINQKKE